MSGFGLLTNNSSSAAGSARLVRTSAKGDKPHNPAEQTGVISIAVKVGLLQAEFLVRGQLARVWGVPHAQAALDPAGRSHDGALMGERVEGSTAVVATCTGLTEAAKGKVGDSNMHVGVVDGRTTRADGREH